MFNLVVTQGLGPISLRRDMRKFIFGVDGVTTQGNLHKTLHRDKVSCSEIIANFTDKPHDHERR